MAAKTTDKDRSQQRPLGRAAAVRTVDPPPRVTMRAWWEWLILAGLAVILLAQLWTGVRRLSVTWDEPDHLHAGYRYLRCGDFGWNPEHPPLAKLVDAIPLLLQKIQDPVVGACGYPNSRIVDFQIGYEFVFANPESVLFSARVAASLFTVALLCVIWIAARSMFGLGVAVLACVLLVFEPNLLAHGALVATDVPAALGVCASIFAFHAYVLNRTRMRMLLAGLATGVAFSLKHSTVLLLPMLVTLAVADPLVEHLAGESAARRIGRNLLAVGIVLVIAVGVLWTAYGWRYAARPDDANLWTTPRVREVSGMVATWLIPQLEAGHLLPQAYLNGLQDVLVTSEVGRSSFILGHLYRSGRWFYFPAAMMIKFSLVVLLLAAVSCAAIRFWRGRRRQLLFLVLPPSMYVAISMTSGLNMGVRHLLPVLAFVVLFGSAGAWALASQNRKLQAAIVVAVVLHAASSLRAFPNYISYSNELWGGPVNTYKHLADADWGQALKQAKAYVDRARPKPCFLVHSYYATNRDYGIDCGEVSRLSHEFPPVHYSGTLIVSSSVVDGIDTGLGGARLAAIFRGLEPKVKLGGSALLVYEGDFDLSALAAYQHLSLARTELRENNLQRAMEEAETAVGLAPASPDAHMLICSLALARGELVRAESECNEALRLYRNDPNATALDSRSVTRFMHRNGISIRAPLQ